MTKEYITKEGEVLDWICWKHYGAHSQVVASAIMMNPQLSEFDPLLQGYAVTLSQRQGDALTGVVEQVLASNPGLADYEAVLPAGITIFLPKIDESKIDMTKSLWD